MKGKVSAVDVSVYLASEMKMLGGFAPGFLGRSPSDSILRFYDLSLGGGSTSFNLQLSP